MSEVRYGYMDATDFAWHLGEEPEYPAKIYASKEAVLKNEKCAKECGVVKVEIRVVEDE